MIGQLVELLKQANLYLDAEQIADSLWLAQQIQTESSLDISKLELTGNVKTVVIKDSVAPSLDSSPPVGNNLTPQKAATAYPLESIPSDQQSGQKLPFWAPAARSLRDPLELGRALRPLRRKVPSRTLQVMDEQATAEQIAATQTWMPTMQPAPERWLDLVLVVEETSLIEVWRKTINEFQQLLAHSGAFRNVQAWTMRRSGEGKQELFARHSHGKATGRKHDPKELIDPSQRRLILVVSDCTSMSWWQGLVHEWLKLWATHNWVTVVQLLPEQLWQRGVLGEGLSVWLRAKEPEAKSTQWVIEGLPGWRQVETKGAVTFPVVTLAAQFLGQWAQMLGGMSDMQTAGVLFEPGWLDEVEKTDDQALQSLDPEFLVRRFQVTASPLAQRLAILMAAAPVNLRVVELIQQTLLPESRQEVLPFAEVTADVLRQMGGQYAAFAEDLQQGMTEGGKVGTESVINDQSADFPVPPLQTFEFEFARV